MNALPPSEEGHAATEGGATNALARAVELHQAGELDAAGDAYRAIIETTPGDAEAHHLLGVLEHERGRVDAAADLIADAILLDPCNAEFHNNLGAALLSMGRLEDARDQFIYAMTLDPSLADPHFNLGCILHQHGDRMGAIRRYARTLAIDRRHAAAMVNLAGALIEEHRLEDAEPLLRRALELEPEDVDAIKNLAHIRRYQGAVDEACTLLDQAIGLAPRDAGARFAHAAALLARGSYRRGFEELEWRFRLPAAPRRRFPRGRWDGSPLEGKTILLHDEDDPTDAIQFARFVNAVADRGGRVVIECQRPLARLFAAMPGVSAAVTRGQRMPRPSAYAPLISLARILGVTQDTVPRDVPYLSVPDDARRAVPLPGDRGRLVGLVWSDRTTSDDRQRQVPLEALAPVLRAGGRHIVSLQHAATEDELARLDEVGAVHLGDEPGDLADLAGAIARLDLLIAVDAPAAHLAGALGRPVWALIPYLAEWRWAGTGAQSLWYPTMRLYRQHQPRDWDDVGERVAVALTGWLESRRLSTAAAS